MNLEELIRFENENTNLDFKKEEYRKEKNEDLIKDVMSMANAISEETKYIIIGIKCYPDSKKEFQGISSIMDQANLENVIQENIEPLLRFKYYSYNIDDKMFGVIEIGENRNRPYMMKKDYGKLKKGEMWIRKGSRQTRVTREDLDRMILKKSQSVFLDKAKVGFHENLKDHLVIEIPRINESLLPSNIGLERYNELLKDLRNYKKQESIELSKDKFQNAISGLGNMFGDYRSSNQSIKAGYNEFNLPVYYTEEDLLKKINNIKNVYYENDYYFRFEENSLKLNFYILNSASVFLEDVEINFRFDKSIFFVSEHLPEKPQTTSQMIRYSVSNVQSFMTNYPYVTLEGSYYRVEETFVNLRHKETTKIFDEDLRVCVFKDAIGHKHEIPYKISAKNLPDPVEGLLNITVHYA